MHDYNRFLFILLSDQIAVIGDGMRIKHQHLQMFSLKLNRLKTLGGGLALTPCFTGYTLWVYVYAF